MKIDPNAAHCCLDNDQTWKLAERSRAIRYHWQDEDEADERLTSRMGEVLRCTRFHGSRIVTEVAPSVHRPSLFPIPSSNCAINFLS